MDRTTVQWPEATREEMADVFQLCRTDNWTAVLRCLQEKPWIAVTPMIMDNHIATTVVHQAITSKGSTELRAKVIRQILRVTPQAAAIKNGYGSLPLHVIAQRNTRMDAQTKEKLIFDLVAAYKGALTEEGGVGKRTPLHIIFTDYISPRLTQMMIDNGAGACFMKDKKGFLPAHVACSRHCSPEKLRMVLAVNPDSLYEKTKEGETLLSLATSTATKSHPNYALINELNRHLDLPQHAGSAAQSSSGDFGSSTSIISDNPSDASSRGRLDSNDSNKSWPNVMAAVPPGAPRATRKRKSLNDVGIKREDNPLPYAENPADLLLHFSRHQPPRDGADDSSQPMNVYEV